MKCPKCKEETKVLEKRNSSDLESVRRRRECQSCGHRFTTYEKC
ncbi:MAG: transcriptional regulator NrdR, partial [Patescibacteria group bacterium]|nr:transcriptional regulator NrdR [Patescibacteria group bacterium]